MDLPKSLILWRERERREKFNYVCTVLSNCDKDNDRHISWVKFERIDSMQATSSMGHG